MKFLLSSIVALLATSVGVDAHSYLTEPTPRGVGQVCRFSAPSDQFGKLSCRGPCDQPNPGAALHTRRRGDRVNIAWSRNNHGGGFIRLAWAPTSQSQNAAVFNDNIQKFSCYEVGSANGQNCQSRNGGASGGGDDMGTQGKACNTAIEIPQWLPNGRYTLQWSWFGGVFDFGDYYSCADFEIIGDNPPAQFGRAANGANPVFEGGDTKYSGQQQCEFVNADRINVCDQEPCGDPVNTASRAPFKDIFPYNQRRGGRPFSAQPLVLLPGRQTFGPSIGSAAGNNPQQPGGTPVTPPAQPPSQPNPPAPTGDGIDQYDNGMPRTIGTSGAFTVGVQYSSTAPSLIFADLLRTGTWEKLGFATARVGVGRGQLNLRLDAQGRTAGTNYVINAWIVKADAYNQDPNTAWQRAVLKAFPVTIVDGNAATYALGNAIDGIPGQIPNQLPLLAVGAEFQASFSYTSTTTRVLQVDVLSPQYDVWFGSGSVTVPGGRGRATITVPISAGFGARTALILNLVSKAPGTEWNTPGSIVRGFPVTVNRDLNTIRLASADDTTFFNTSAPTYENIPTDAFDNDVDVAKQTCVAVNATYCAPITTAAGKSPNMASTNAVGSACALVITTVVAFLAF